MYMVFEDVLSLNFVYVDFGNAYVGPLAQCDGKMYGQRNHYDYAPCIIPNYFQEEWQY